MGSRAFALAGLAILLCLTALPGCAGDIGRGEPASAESGGTAVPVSRGAAEFEQQMVKVVKSVSPAVVQVQTQSGLGSGVVFDHSGDVVTNAHVVGGATTLLVTLSDGGRHRAKLVGIDRARDLAVVRMAGARPDPASFADSSTLQPGAIAIAIGNPLGLRSSVTQGIVSSVGRKLSERAGVTLESAIQTSAEINPGNSGGALVDLSGRVIGVPTVVALDPQIGGAAPGIGFAIPSNTVDRVAGGLIASGGD